MKIREILRLRDLGMNNVQIAQGCNCSRTTVIEMLKRAEEAKLAWPEAETLNDHQLKQRIYPTMAGMSVKKPDPDFEAINRELKRSGVNMKLLLVHMSAYDGFIAGQVFLAESLGYFQRLFQLDFTRREGLYDVEALGAVQFAISFFRRQHVLVRVVAAAEMVSRIDLLNCLGTVEHIADSDVHPRFAGKYLRNRHSLLPREFPHLVVYLTDQIKRLCRSAVRINYPGVGVVGDLVDVHANPVNLRMQVADGFRQPCLDWLVHNQSPQIGAPGQTALLCFSA